MDTVLEYIRNSLLRDLADKFVFVAVTGLVVFVLAWINRERLRHKYPLGGTYISHYDYLAPDSKAPDVAIINLRQHGKLLYGDGFSPRLNRRWRYTAYARSAEVVAGEFAELPFGSHQVFYWRRTNYLKDGLTEFKGMWCGHSHHARGMSCGNETLTPVARVNVVKAERGPSPHECMMALRQLDASDQGWPEGDRDCRAFVALLDGAVVGGAAVVLATAEELAVLNSALKPTDSLEASTGIVHGLRVEEDWCGRGIGSSLVTRLLTEAARGGLTKAVAILSRAEADRGGRFFSALGFTAMDPVTLARPDVGTAAGRSGPLDAVVCSRQLRERDRDTFAQRAQAWLDVQWDYYIERRLNPT